MTRTPLARLVDIVESIDHINHHLHGKSFECFLKDKQARDAMQRRLEITSEAIRHIPNDLKLYYSYIPWLNVAILGNILRHE